MHIYLMHENDHIQTLYNSEKEMLQERRSF